MKSRSLTTSTDDLGLSFPVKVYFKAERLYATLLNPKENRVLRIADAHNIKYYEFHPRRGTEHY